MRMNVYDSLKSVKFNIIEGDRVTVEDFWDKDCSIFKKERIYLIKSGTAWMFLKGKKIFLEPNKLYFIPSYSVLYGKTLSQLEHYFIHFEFESDGVDIFSLFHLINEVPASQEDEYFLDKLLKLMKMSSYSPQVQLQENGIMQILLSKFLTSLEFNDENALRINTTLNYINDNIGRTITLEELAERHHLNPVYFSHLFKQVVGVSPSQYILNKRISYATMLLSRPEKSIAEIAELAGFSDPMYFSRIFKIKTGMPPQAFRKSLKANNTK